MQDAVPARATMSAMKLYIKTPTADIFTLDVLASDTVAMVKQKIQDKEGLSTD
jgi:hypothetical protein